MLVSFFMNEATNSDIRVAAVGHCLFILIISLLLGEAVSSDEALISTEGAAGLVGWVAGVGAAHLAFTALRRR